MGKPITVNIMFVKGDFERPFGTLPSALLALTEDKANIEANRRITLKFDVHHLLL